MSKIGQYLIELEELGEIEHNGIMYQWVDHRDQESDFMIKWFMAQALIDEGFAFDFYASEGHMYIRTNPHAKNSAFDPELEIFADNYEACLQAFVLEDYLKEHYNTIWHAAKKRHPAHIGQRSQRLRLKRIWWAFSWLVEKLYE